MIRIAEITCPEGHPRASSVYDSEKTTAATAELATRQSYATMCHCACGLCDSAEVKFVDRETNYDTLGAAAIGEQLRAAEHIQKLMARFAFKKGNRETN